MSKTHEFAAGSPLLANAHARTHTDAAGAPLPVDAHKDKAGCPADARNALLRCHYHISKRHDRPARLRTHTQMNTGRAKLGLWQRPLRGAAADPPCASGAARLSDVWRTSCCVCGCCVWQQCVAHKLL